MEERNRLKPWHGIVASLLVIVFMLFGGVLLYAAFGEDGVEFDVQIAAGDSNTCSTIVNAFVAEEVDLKRAAKVANEKSIEMIPVKEIKNVTIL